MHFLDLAEHTRRLAQTAATLDSLEEDVQQIRDGDIGKPVRELAPIVIRTQELAKQCAQQLLDLSTSQYAHMKGGEESLAHLAEGSAQVSYAAALSAVAITSRTEVLLYDDADATPQASRRALRDASSRMQSAAAVYRGLAQRLSRRLASAAARKEDQKLIERGLADHNAVKPSTAAGASAPVSSPAPSAGAVRTR